MLIESLSQNTIKLAKKQYVYASVWILDSPQRTRTEQSLDSPIREDYTFLVNLEKYWVITSTLKKQPWLMKIYRNEVPLMAGAEFSAFAIGLIRF